MKVKQKPSLHASWIDPFAKEIVQRLQGGGFKSYLVGGCVRDLLVGIHPKDFDIATNASPQQVKKKIYNSYIIGRRFRLVLAKRGDQQYEISTFRREAKPEDFQNLPEGEDAPSGDNFFGTPEEDAIRRDFTINALFYDPMTNEVIDYAEGMKDIEFRTLRMIGDPATRIHEDPIRSLRAIRLSHKINFVLEESLRRAIQENAEACSKALMPRKREEYLKFLRLNHPGLALQELHDLGLMKILLPTLEEVFLNNDQRERFLQHMNLWSRMVKNPHDTIEIYASLIWCYSVALENMKGFEAKMDKLLKDELGVFKTESAGIEQVFQLQSRLQDTLSFQKRGERRRIAFLQNEGFPLALRLAEIDYALPSSIIHFWKNQLESLEKLSRAPRDAH